MCAPAGDARVGAWGLSASFGHASRFIFTARGSSGSGMGSGRVGPGSGSWDCECGDVVVVRVAMPSVCSQAVSAQEALKYDVCPQKIGRVMSVVVHLCI